MTCAIIITTKLMIGIRAYLVHLPSRHAIRMNYFRNGPMNDTPICCHDCQRRLDFLSTRKRVIIAAVLGE